MKITRQNVELLVGKKLRNPIWAHWAYWPEYFIIHSFTRDRFFAKRFAKPGKENNLNPHTETLEHLFQWDNEFEFFKKNKSHLPEFL